MKTQIILFSSIIALGFASCNDNATKTNTTTDTAATAATMGANGDTTVKTTTTTTSTTTSTSIHPIANFEHRTFVSVKTGKKIKLKVDTIHHYYIDVNTNQQPEYYYFDPATHDTFDYRGRILNHALIYNNGTYNVDETRLTDNGSSSDAGMNANTQDNTGTSTSTDNANTEKGPDHMKVKQKGDMYKEKTDNSKLKITDKKIKSKDY